jgi:phosphatidylglycerophosphate synthase
MNIKKYSNFITLLIFFVRFVAYPFLPERNFEGCVLLCLFGIFLDFFDGFSLELFSLIKSVGFAARFSLV